MKVKAFTCTVLLVAFVFFSKAQNLVPNYSFEDTISCPGNIDEFVGYVANWDGGGAAGITYFGSFCNYSNPLASVPLNYMGYQEPRTGRAYAGIFSIVKSYPPHPQDTNQRGYLQTKLSSPLVNGITYYATLYVSLADSSQYSCSNLGIYFSDSGLMYSPITFVKSYLTPQIQNNPITNPLTDTLHWIKISGKYTAAGGEKYMVIGNFLPNYKCDTVYYPPISGSSLAEPLAFYYIDDVILSPDSNYLDSLATAGVNEVAVSKEKSTIYPNPNNGRFTIQMSEVRSQNSEVEVYNMLGEKIYSTAFSTQHSAFNINISNQPSGVYLCRIINENGNLIKADKVMIVH